MAAARKKQDEKNLKTLRELGSLPQNKYCFDCNQRGPTYVNVTIGSFVCTKCSGMLRGLTPPHRVKSISMATFTTEEVDLLKTRGNEYCKKVWLGLYDKQPPGGEIRDEQTIRDFMVDKYEKKRYYLEPAQAFKNGFTTTTTTINNEQQLITTNNEQNNKFKPLSALITDPKPIKFLNGGGNLIRKTPELRKRPEVNNKSNFIVNFDNVDIFSSNNNNYSNNINNNSLATNNQNKQEEFANFDDNPVFNNTNLGMPMASNLDNLNTQQIANTMPVKTTSAAPPEDRYAALKDLDNALKSQQNSVDWNSTGGSNGSLYGTPTGSMYSSPSPQNSLFGSPSQGFINVFHQDQSISNPFNNPPTNNTITNGFWSNQTFNPFRDPIKNGFNPGFQNVQPVNGQWTPNPFKVIGNGMNSTNNPFL